MNRYALLKGTLPVLWRWNVTSASLYSTLSSGSQTKSLQTDLLPPSGCSLTDCFLMSFSLFDPNQPYWEDRVMQKVTSSHFTWQTVSLLSGKCISSCQHFCSLPDWALCSAVTPLQKATFPPNSCAICPGSRLATNMPTHPRLPADRVVSP